MSKEYSKRCISYVLAVFMLVTTIFGNFPGALWTTRADAATTTYDVTWDGEAVQDNAVTIYYGDEVSWALQDYDGNDTPTFTYISTDVAADELADATWSSWGDYVLLEPGTYYLGYESEEGGVILDDTYTVTVEAGTIGEPANLSWNNKIAQWEAPTTTVTGGSIEDNAIGGYVLTLYCDGEQVGDAINCSNTTTDYEFTSTIANHGYGLYTFTVSAVVANAYQDHYAQSPQATVETELDYHDTTAPVVNGISVSDDGTKMVGSAIDEHTGIYGYAFSTQSDASELTDADWTEVTDTVEKNVTEEIEYTPTEAGVYYFYVKDQAGNITRSDDTMAVTQVVYHDGTYTSGVAADETQLVIGNDTITELYSGNRKGYVLSGWHAASDLSDEAVTQIETTSLGGSVDLYADWTKQTIDVTVTSDAEGSGDTEKIYDGEAVTLTAHIAQLEDESLEYDSISYQWYKADEAIDGATDATYAITDVAQSGAYYVVATVAITGEEDQSGTNETPVTVTINKAALTVTADEQTVTYGDAAPTYTFTYEGFVNGEDESNITVGEATCAYAKGDDAGSYDITIEENSGFAADNYSLSYVGNTLTVNAKSVEADGAGVSAVLTIPEGGYTYDLENGVAVSYEPEVTVTDSVILDSDVTLVAGETNDYVVTYTDNNKAGSATVTITFHNNYSGTITKTFDIAKQTFTATVSISNWKYGDYSEDCGPTVDQLGENTTSDIVYQYREASESEDDTAWTTTRPSDAGDYQVRAIVPATDNYEEVTTDAVNFSIEKRILVLSSQSGSWIYNGAARTLPDVTIEDSYTNEDNEVITADGLATEDDFKTYGATGTITAVGSVENTISYEFTSTTNADNYEVVLVPGTLTVTQAALSAPDYSGWNTSSAGLANWSAVTRTGVQVQYNLKLYREEGDVDVQIGDVYTTTSTSYDFSDIIHEDAQAAGYYYTIEVEPVSGTNAGNYTNSVLGSSTYLYTAKVTVTGDSGVDTVTIGDATSASGESTYAYLIEGEQVVLSTTYARGYKAVDTIWALAAGSETALTIADATAASTKVTLSDLDAATDSLQITAGSTSTGAEGSIAFDSYGDDYQSVNYTLTITDEKGIGGYYLATAIDENLSVDADGWVAPQDGEAVDNGSYVTYAKTLAFDEAGTYYIAIKDDDNNLVWLDDAVKIYSVAFDANGGSGESMASLLKAQDQDITLPANTYTYTGKGFSKWLGTNSTYNDQATYDDNVNDTLVAQWTDDAYTLNVNYYYMDTTGAYPETADETAEVSATYGSAVAATDVNVAKTMTGMSLDTGKTLSSVTVTEDGQTYNVYYKRAQYTLSYSYTQAGTTDTTEQLGSYQYYYGQEITTEEDKPTADGYDFVGWVYGSTGSKPDTMPNQNLSATGSFVAQSAYYKVNYYVMNLDGTAYTLLTEETDTNTSSHDEVLDFAVSDAKDISGYTAQMVKVTYGSAGTADATDASTTSATGTVSAIQPEEGNEDAFTGTDGTLQVNYYYSRNTYTLTLNVWRGDHSNSDNQIYKAYWSYQYGETLSGAEEMAEYFTNVVYGDGTASVAEPTVTIDYDGSSLDSYKLADYTDWSTGDEPTTMPAGNVSVTKDYIEANKVAYQVYVYRANANNAYTDATPTIITYYGNVGEEITIGETEDDDVLYSSLATIVDSNLLDNYEYDTDTTNGQDTITSLSETATDNILKIYFKRKTVTATIKYWVRDADGDHEIATETKRGIWGNYYDPEPMKYFTGYYMDENYNRVEEDGEETNSFRKQGYVVSYAGYSLRSGNHYYPAMTFTSSDQWVDSTSADYYYTSSTEKSRGGYFCENKYGSSERKSYINVYYSKTGDPISLDVQYKEYGQTAVPLTVSYNGTDYPVRLINKRLAVHNEPVTSGADELYPGADVYNIDYTYDDTVNEGYTDVTDAIHELEEAAGSASSCEYYLWDQDGDGTDDYLCMVPSEEISESFIAGSRIGYSMSTNSNSLAHVTANSLLAAFNEENNDKYTWNNHSQSGVFYADTTLTYEMKEKTAHYMYYYLDGQLIGNSEEYYSGTRTQSEVTAEGKKFATANQLVKSGYTIEWYADSGYTTKLSDSYDMSSDHSIYGKSVKSKEEYHKYIHYELADDLTYDGDTINYLTEAQIEAMTDSDGDGVYVLEDTDGNSYEFTRVKTTGEEVTIEDGLGGSYTYTPEVYLYYYNDELVLRDENHSTYTYSSISLTYADYTKDNFHFDDTNTDNVLNGYCETSIFDLDAYYARDTYNLIVNTNNTTSSTWKQYTYKIGETVTLANPTKDGYTFAGWTWRSYTTDSSGNITQGDVIDIAETTVTDGITVQMQAQNISVLANWEPGPYDQTITHYFQTTDFAYESERLANIQSILAAASETELSEMTKWIVVDGADPVSGYVVTSDDSVLGLVVTDDSATNYYLPKSVNDDGTIYETDSSKIFASVTTEELQSETAYAYGDYSKAVEDKFAFSNVIYQYGKEIVTTTDTTKTFTAAVDTKLDYYYTRDTNYALTLAAKSTDGGDASATLAGAGSGYTYGQDVTVGAIAATGYTFVGWYEAADVLDDYTVGDDLVSTDATMTYSMEDKSSNLIAVLSPDDVALATVTLTSDVTTYDYGYTQGKNLKANVTMTDATSTTYIKGYQWYLVDGETRTAIEGATSATYPFATGKDAGTYTYSCDVTIARSDNGREVVYTEAQSLTITVNQIDMPVTVAAYEGTYDATAHNISLDVALTDVESDDYAIYYSDSTELDSTNYETAGTTDLSAEAKTNVKDAAGSAYTIYYYVVPLDETLANNYKAVAGSSTIDINPIELSVEATGETFTSTYTGSTSVEGSVLEEGTDKYELAHGGYFTVSGWYSDEASSYEVDFDAEYNSVHVSEAGSISVSNIIVIDNAGNQNYNYVVSSGAQVELTATLTEKVIDVTWKIASDDAYGTMTTDTDGVQSATYNYTGTKHLPQVSFDNADGELESTLTLSVTGGQTAAGTYTATASLSSTQEDLDLGDYELSQATCDFTIEQIAILVKPIDETVTYDGQKHTISTYGLYQLNETTGLYELMNGLDADGAAVQNEDSVATYASSATLYGKTYTFTATTAGTDNTDGQYTDAGTYEETTASVQLKDSDGKVVTDNFAVTYDTANLTITPAEITVEGIKANDKIYDGSTDATLDFSEVTFDGLVSNDSLSLDTTKVTGTFDTAKVGSDKEVTIVILNGALTGDDQDNYELVITDTDIDAQVSTTTADIAKALLAIAPTAQDTTYGEETQLGAGLAISGSLIGTDTMEEVAISGSLTFVVTSKSDSTTTHQYTYAVGENATLSTLESMAAVSYEYLSLPAGEYTVTLDTSALSVDDYSIVSYLVSDDVQVATSADLTVEKRQVTVSAVNETYLSKDYDGTTQITDDQQALLTTQATAADDVYGNEYVNFTGVITSDQSSFGFDATSPFTATYGNANVNESVTGTDSSDNPVTLTNMQLNNENYELATTSVELIAKITPIALTLTADDKTTTYGSTVTDGETQIAGYDTDNCTVTTQGLLSGETITDVLNDEVTYTTTYVSGTGTDATAQGTYPNVGSYTISIVENSAKYGNYTITYEPGTLTVNQAVITVAMKENVTGVYGEDVDHDSFDVVYSGFMFDDTESVISGRKSVNYGFSYTSLDDDSVSVTLTPSGDTKTHASPDHAGQYSVTPSNDSWSALNYSFTVSTADPKYYIVGKKSIVLGANGNLVVDDKVYDGTTAVSEDQIKYYTNDQLQMIENGEDAGDPSSYDSSLGFFTDSDGNSVLLDEDLAYLQEKKLTGIEFNLDTSKTYYAQKDVKVSNGEIADIKVTLSYSLIGRLSQKYEIVASSSQATAYSAITRRDLTICAVATPDAICYGDEIPAYSNEYDGFVSGESVTTSGILETETDTLTDHSVQGDYGEIWTCDYTAQSNSYGGVTTYTVVPSGFTEGANNNYNVSYVSATFDVETATLATPEPTWSTSDIGTVSFDAIADIGDVSVTAYHMNLYYKSNDATEYTQLATYDFTADDSETYSKDLKETLRDKGPGAYYVDVTAEAGTDNNQNYINVNKDSQAGASKVRYVANVTLTFGESEDTLAAIAQAQKETPDGTMSLTLNDSSTLSYNVVEGEEIPFAMNLTDKIASGYDVASVSATQTAVTFASSPSDDFTMKTDDAVANRDYASSFELTTDLDSSDAITVTVELKAVVNDITAVHLIGTEDNLSDTTYVTSTSIDYGYSSSDSPSFTTQVSTVDGDTITTDDYTFTYEWKYRKSSTAAYVTMETITSDTQDTINTAQFPMNQTYSPNYQIYCEITATRNDNGQTAAVYSTKDRKVNNKAVGTLKVAVNRGDFSARVVLDGWTYGETRNTPYLTEISDTTNTEMTKYPGEDTALPKGITYTYYQKLTADEYSALTSEQQEACTQVNSEYYLALDGQPTEAGTWYVQCYIPHSDNYAEFTTDYTEFTIAQTQLAAPTNPAAPTPGTANGESTYNFGDVTWSAVSGISENAGVKSASQVEVTYAVTLQYQAADSTDWTVVELADEDAIAETNSCNLAEYMTNSGSYKITVKAVSSIEEDALDSEETSVVVDVDGEVLVDGVSLQATEKEKVYDEDAITLSADFGSDLTGVTYAWYRNDTLVGEEETYSVTDVGQSGYYHCVITKADANKTKLYTTQKMITVYPREITVTAASKEQTYSGTAFTDPEASITSETGLAKEDDEIVYTYADTSTITDVGEVANTITDVAITKADGTADTVTMNPSDISGVTTNYAVTTVDGTLTVTKKTLTIAATDRSVSYGQDAEVNIEDAAGWVTYGNALDDADGFVNGETTADLTLADGLEGIAYTYGDYTAGADAGEYVITPYGYASDNYDIQYVTGTLTVEPIDNTVELTAQDITYDGQAYDTDSTRLTLMMNGTGEVTYTYYEQNADNEYDALESAPTDAGSYGVIAHVASDGNYNDADTQMATYTIAKKALTFTPVAFSVLQGTTLTQGEQYVDGDGYTVEGFADGESEDNLTLADGLSTMDYRYVVDTQTPTYYDTTTPYGEYTIVIRGYASDNYEITYNTATLTVTGETDDNIELSAPDMTYDGQPYDEAQLTTSEANAGEVTYTYYALNADHGYDVLESAPTEVGSYGVKASIASDGHYFEVETEIAPFTINKKSLTITAENAEISFGEEAANNGVTYDGFVDGESQATEGLLEGTLSYTYTDENQVAYEAGNVETGKAGDYLITPSGYTAANYEIVYQVGTMTVAPIEATVSLQAESVVYNGKAYDAAEDLSTRLTLTTNSTGDVASYTYYVKNDNNEYEALEEAPKDAGQYGVTATIEADTNYVETTSEIAEFEITQAPLSVTANDVTTSYNQDATGNGVTYSGFVNGETEAVLSGSLAYTFTYVDDNNETQTYQAGDALGNQYVVTPSGYTADNYEITYVSGVMTVVEAENEITLEADDAVYTGSAYDVENQVTATYHEAGDLTYTYYREVSEGNYEAIDAAPVDVGNYALTVTVGASALYKETTSSKATFAITKAPLKVTAHDKEINYGAEAPASYEADYDGFVNDETEAVLSGTLSYACEYAQGYNAGEYEITVSGLTSDNYEIAYEAGTLNVAKLANGASLTATSINYDGNAYDTDKNVTLTMSGDGEVTYIFYSYDGDSTYTLQGTQAPTDPGRYGVAADIAEGTNYKKATTEIEDFTINPLVTFDYNDDELVEASEPPSSKHVAYGTALSQDGVEAPTRENYEFQGWYTSDGVSAEDMPVTENTTVYAQWKETVAPNGSIVVNTYDIWTAVLDEITFGLRYKTAKTATITGVDDGVDASGNQTNVVNSGMDKIYYHVESATESVDVTTYTAAELLAKDDTFWSDYTDPVELAYGSYYVVYAKLVDQAGNVTYMSTNGLDIHDNTVTNETLYNEETSSTDEDGITTNKFGNGYLKTEVDIVESSSNEVVKKTKEKEEDTTDDSTTFEVAQDFGLESAVTTLDNEEIYLTDSDEATLSLRVQDVDEDDSDYQSDKKQVETYVKGTTEDEIIGAYVDISLYLTKNGEETKLVNTNSNDVTITLAIPDDLTGKESYEIVRVHNGKAELVTDEVTDDEITFTTNKFSTYAIVYTEKETDSGDGNKNSSGSDSGSNSGSNSGSDNSSSSSKEKEYLEKTNDSGVSGQDVADALGVDAETASKILDMMDKYNVSLDTISLTDSALTSQKNDKDPKGTKFSQLKARAVKCKKHSMVIKWSKQTGADGYEIYGNYCNKGGKVYKKKLIKTVSKNKTKVKMKHLKKGRYYKYIVRAYKIINGKKVTIAASCTIHATTTGGKLGVAKAIKIKKVGKKKSTKITLKKGKKAKIKAVEVRQIKSKRIPVHRAISYEVSNSKVAKVTKSGKIKAKKKGKCKIWVYAQNGVYKTITLTVK